MRRVNFPQVGDVCFLIHKAVIIKEVLEEFHIAKVCYIHSSNDFYTEITALTQKPNFDIRSLDITLFVEV